MSSMVLVASAISVYLVVLITYRLLLSPIAQFPGPKLAAATFWYEVYYDVILGGQYTNKIIELHKKYGPIIRINPEELHIADPLFYSPLYSPAPHPSAPTKAPKRHKWHYSVRATGFAESGHGTTTHHDMHRMRRKPLELFFSPAQVKKLQAMIHEKVEWMCTRIKAEADKGGPVKIKLAYSCLATDIISQYCLGRSHDFLSYPGFFPEFSDTLNGLGKSSNILKPFPWLMYVLEYMPVWVIKLMGPGPQAVFSLKGETIELLKEIKATKAAKENGLGGEDKGHPTIFHELLDSNMPPHEKTDARMQAEMVAMLAAGTETTGSTLGILTVYLLENPKILKKLKEELDDAMPDSTELPQLQVLEKLPYLTAIIREGLRLSYGVWSRLPRISETDLQYKDWHIPAGTPCSMSSAIVHTDPSIWPEPEKFSPERWLDPAESARLLKYMVSFSKGSRMCLGINLAHAELYMALAAVFRRFDMELYDYSVNDLQVVADWFIPKWKRDLSEIKVYLK